MKKITWFFLFIACWTNAQSFNSGGIGYSILIGNNVRIASINNTGQCYTGALVLPSTVSNNGATYTITAIGAIAFRYCTTLTSIVIPNSVRSIGNGAFDGCTSLNSITLSSALVNIGGDTFRNCSSLTSMIIPNLVTAIDYSAFEGCTTLTSITIPASVTLIDDDAFKNCTSLNTVNCSVVTPIVINANVFLNVNQSTCALNVPAGSLTAYQGAPVWKLFNVMLSTSTFDATTKLEIYPNPTNGVVNFNINEPVSIELFDIVGKSVGATKIDSGSSSFDFSNYTAGVYLVKATNETGATKTYKLVKN